MDNENHQAPRAGAADEPALDSLLRHATSRPAPPPADRRAIERAVREEWLRITGRRRLLRRAVAFSVAASLALVVASTLWHGAAPTGRAGAAEVARVDRVSGRVSVLAGDAAAHGAVVSGGISIFGGQTLRTAGGSGIALAFDGGLSLRVDQNSVVEVTSDKSVRLESGRLYVDTGSDRPGGSAMAPGSSRHFPLEITSASGTVRHLGTQYMVKVDDQRLKVSVRRGAVRVIAADDDAPPIYVSDGKQLSLSEHGEPRLVPTDIHGDPWRWAEELGPGFVLDGRSLDEFLAWVARETGLELTYSSYTARHAAEQTVLHGTIDLPAREALDVVLMSSDLSAKIGDGAIEVGQRP